MRSTKARTNGAAPAAEVGPKVLGQLDAEDTAYLRGLIAAVQKAQHELQAFGNYQMRRRGIVGDAHLNEDGTFLAVNREGG